MESINKTSINYLIKSTKTNKEIKLNIDIVDIESKGLHEHLLDLGILTVSEGFEVLSRTLYEESVDLKSPHITREPFLNPNQSQTASKFTTRHQRISPAKSPNYETSTQVFSTSNQNQRQDGDPRLSFPLKEFRVYLHSIEFFKGSEYPEFIDVMAPTKGKALINALHECNIFEFPEEWRIMKAIPTAILYKQH